MDSVDKNNRCAFHVAVAKVKQAKQVDQRQKDTRINGSNNSKANPPTKQFKTFITSIGRGIFGDTRTETIVAFQQHRVSTTQRHDNGPFQKKVRQSSSGNGIGGKKRWGATKS